MSKPIENEISMQIYGDAKLQEKVLKIVSTALDTEVFIKDEKDYETKRGMTGHYMAVKVKVGE